MADRFIVVHKELNGITTSTNIIVDTVTGVNYLWHKDGYSGGLTVLLDKDGKPVISKTDK